MGLPPALLVAVLIGVAIDEHARERAQEPMLEGRWRLVSVEQDGSRLSDAVLEGSALIIGRETYSFVISDLTTQHGKYKVDSTKEPKRIDLIPTDSSHKSPSAGIYELRDGALRLCYGPVGKPRPDSFTTNPSSDRVLLVLKKEKR